MTFGHATSLAEGGFEQSAAIPFGSKIVRFCASFYISVICFSSLSSGFTSAPAAGMVRVR